MLKTELLEIIASGENSGIEFKRDDIRPEQLIHEAPKKIISGAITAKILCSRFNGVQELCRIRTEVTERIHNNLRRHAGK